MLRIDLVLCLCCLLQPASALQAPLRATRRRVLLVAPLAAAAPLAATAFELPSIPALSLPSLSSEPSAADVAARAAEEQRKAAEVDRAAAKMAQLKKVRAERMAAEAQAQSAEYRRIQSGVGTASFGSTVSVRDRVFDEE